MLTDAEMDEMERLLDALEKKRKSQEPPIAPEALRRIEHQVEHLPDLLAALGVFKED